MIQHDKKEATDSRLQIDVRGLRQDLRNPDAEGFVEDVFDTVLADSLEIEYFYDLHGGVTVSTNLDRSKGNYGSSRVWIKPPDRHRRARNLYPGDESRAFLCRPC